MGQNRECWVITKNNGYDSNLIESVAFKSLDGRESYIFLFTAKKANFWPKTKVFDKFYSFYSGFELINTRFFKEQRF